MFTLCPNYVIINTDRRCEVRNNSADLHLTIPKELKRKLGEEAKRKGLNLSNLVRMILIEAFERE